MVLKQSTSFEMTDFERNCVLKRLNLKVLLAREQNHLFLGQEIAKSV
jgi:hypothetical protein